MKRQTVSEKLVPWHALRDENKKKFKEYLKAAKNVQNP